jgi:thymidylate synthase (FAD)
MKIIDAGYEIMDNLDGEAILKKVELCGRVCYKSEDRISSESAAKFIRGIIKSGHESVLEHVSFSVRFIVDRGVSHELVRHRIASFSQESTRYCNYGNSKEITVIKPLFWAPFSMEYDLWKRTCMHDERVYLSLIDNGATPQEARSVLPNSLKTEVIMSADLREWRHFLKLRAAKAAHPQMQEVAIPLLIDLQEKIPPKRQAAGKTSIHRVGI